MPVHATNACSDSECHLRAVIDSMTAATAAAQPDSCGVAAVAAKRLLQSPMTTSHLCSAKVMLSCELLEFQVQPQPNLHKQ